MLWYHVCNTPDLLSILLQKYNYAEAVINLHLERYRRIPDIGIQGFLKLTKNLWKFDQRLFYKMTNQVIDKMTTCTTKFVSFTIHQQGHQ